MLNEQIDSLNTKLILRTYQGQFKHDVADVTVLKYHEKYRRSRDITSCSDVVSDEQIEDVAAAGTARGHGRNGLHRVVGERRGVEVVFVVGAPVSHRFQLEEEHG